MNPSPPRQRSNSARLGYTFAEVLMASTLLGAAIGGAVALAANLNLQFEASRCTSIALNYQDNAARVWQLGLSAAETLSIMPDAINNDQLDSAIVRYAGTPEQQVSFTNVTTTTLANDMGTLSTTACSVTIRNAAGGTDRATTVQVYR
ncbi:MAG: hypothetical protein ACOYMN_01115 [Roseimicrobium sp.]